MTNLPFERYDKNLIENENALSPSVRNLFHNINRNYKTISSLEVIEELCKMHPEYANGNAGKFPFLYYLLWCTLFFILFTLV